MFIAIDVETANADISSICQIGLASFDTSGFKEGWKSYVDPEDEFDPTNIGIHGIDEECVRGSPTYETVFSTINEILDDSIVVCHTHFDRLAITRVAEKYNVRTPSCDWLDSAKVARRTWTQFAQRGYGLANIAAHIGYNFQHHDALEDAKAAGQIVLAAMRDSGHGIEEWLVRARRPITKYKANVSKDGNPEGPLYGENVVFTGALSIPRREATEVAAQLGCTVRNSVTKKTTLLVVSDQDVRRLGGQHKSRKHRTAESLISQGLPIRIVRESDFRRLLELDS